MTSRHIERHSAIQGEAADLLEMAMERLSLSARAYDRILEVGRTIADLAAQDPIAPEHSAEAIQHRSLDRAPRRQVARREGSRTAMVTPRGARRSRAMGRADITHVPLDNRAPDDI